MSKARHWRMTFIIFGLAIAAGIGNYVIKNLGSVNIPPDKKVGSLGDYSNIIGNLSVPEGFSIKVYASSLPSVRVIEFDDRGRLIVSQTSEGKISLLEDKNGDGFAESNKILADNLKRPHGLAFRCDSEGKKCFLYVAEHDKLTKYAYDSITGSLGDSIKLLDLPSSVTDRHFTRTLNFLPPPEDNVILIAVGSSCNVCHEDEIGRGGIIAYDVVNNESSVYATGLRNSVFMTTSYVDGRIFATEMGRDGLGDDIPPDEINIIEKGKNYGWPNCYGNNIHDNKFDKNTYVRNPCMEPIETESFIDLQAHSAPLGLSFVPEEGWPEEYWYDLLVAYHGSWNRSVPTGYKIVRLKLDALGNYSGTEDFISGWLTVDGKKLGRPVDVKVFSGGVMYISDDLNGVIYKLSRRS